jgi:putative hydroxymethylpyrimidine transport system ATP-binding protein
MPEPAPGLTVGVRALAYQGVPLFERLRFRLEGGTWTCLLGPSGVGKTTLLRLVAGLGGAVGGALVVADDGAALQGRVALMAQQDLLLPWLSVVDNVLLGHRLRGASSAELRRLREPAVGLLARVGLEREADRLPATLSGGMRQRTALARTLMEDRPIVLMDEPFSALDAITRLRLQEMAARLLAGKTVLLVTHDPLEALRLGHRIHVMAGQPAGIGPAIMPSGPPPRAPDDPALLARQAELLRQLAS